MRKTRTFLNKPKFELLVKNVDVENTTVTLPEVTGHKFGLRVYKPKGRPIQGPLPVMLYFHGGYWCAGDADSEDLGCRAIIARGTDIVILSFGYRLIPTVKWYTVFSDAEYAMKWAWTSAHEYGADRSRGFLIGGAEAGAHLAAISTL